MLTVSNIKYLVLLSQTKVCWSFSFNDLYKTFEGEKELHHALPEEVWLNIFKFLSTRDKCRIGSVCKTFNRFVSSRQLWRQVDLSHLPSLSAGTLRWLLRRAPESITLPSCVNYRSLVWLLSRSPMLRKLQIHGASWNAVSAVNTQQVC